MYMSTIALAALLALGDVPATDENPTLPPSVESHPCAQNAQGWGTRDRVKCRHFADRSVRATLATKLVYQE